MLDETDSSSEHDDRESVEVMREAQALDRAMEDRIVARKSSVSSIASSSGIGMGAAWRSRYGTRKRTGSIASNTTSGSILSENLVEEEEEQELLGVGGGFDDHSLRHMSSSERDTSATNSPESPTEEEPLFVTAVSQPKATPRSALPRPVAARPPPSAPAQKTSFGLPLPPAATTEASFNLPSQMPLRPQGKYRPVPLGFAPPSPPSKIAVAVTPPVVPTQSYRHRIESRKPPPPPLYIRKGPKTSKPATLLPKPVMSTPSQTLFLFPPSPGPTTRTPSTMTLTSNLPVPVPFPAMNTPRVSTFRTGGRTRSFIGLGAPPTPTTACSRVDARGWVGFDVN